jgi:hypothetical protein
MTKKKYSIWAPRTPGSEPTWIGEYDTLEQARQVADHTFGHRKDLRGQDVVIREGIDGDRVEYAGPPR